VPVCFDPGGDFHIMNLLLFVVASLSLPAFGKDIQKNNYPAAWWQPVPRSDAASWEILPQDAKPGEVILSKRTELGILSNFATTPIELDGKTYPSVEGFWQMMKYPEGANDERLKFPRLVWKFTRDQVAKMTGFEAKHAGNLAEQNMKEMNINWVTYQGKKMTYRTAEKGDHYKIIYKAMKAKLEQNAEVRRLLTATGDLILRPDHEQGHDVPPAWKYFEIWMGLRSDLKK
jgi:predicted NAD-dependent protein-ADP-ribosyltransferase YbiA (DUF1768 family)